MSYVAFDTLKFAKKLIEIGMSEEQAEVFVFAQKEALEEAVDGRLATKIDILELKQEITEVKSELEQKIISCEARLEKKINERITDVESTVKVLHWMTGFVLSGVFAIGVKMFFV
jgi:hypothetical protein